MKTWRERTAEARARGCFDRADYEAWRSVETCLVGECRQRFGLDRHSLDMDCVPVLGPVGAGFKPPTAQSAIGYSILTNDFSEVERYLDAIEDEALRIKRGVAR